MASDVFKLLAKTLNWVIAAFGLFLAFIFISISSGKLIVNVTSSLPQTFFWASKLQQDDLVNRGDLIGYLPPEGKEVINPYNAKFLKYVRGIAGDEVAMQELDGKRVFLINDEIIGEAKQVTSTNKLLEAGPTGTLTEDKYFVWTPHEDSYDSRYKTMGWIDRSRFVVRAKPIF